MCVCVCVYIDVLIWFVFFVLIGYSMPKPYF